MQRVAIGRALVDAGILPYGTNAVILDAKLRADCVSS